MKRTGYFRKGFTSLELERGRDNYEKLLADGWIEYDPEGPPDESCFDTLSTYRNPPCLHGYGWQCPRAVAVTKKARRVVSAGSRP
jgi:hypothetical protein